MDNIVNQQRNRPQLMNWLLQLNYQQNMNNMLILQSTLFNRYIRDSSVAHPLLVLGNPALSGASPALFRGYSRLFRPSLGLVLGIPAYFGTLPGYSVACPGLSMTTPGIVLCIPGLHRVIRGIHGIIRDYTVAPPGICDCNINLGKKYQNHPDGPEHIVRDDPGNDPGRCDWVLTCFECFFAFEISIVPVIGRLPSQG